MFFENEVTRTLTLFEFLLVALIGLAPAAISIWIEPVFARSRVAEDEKGSPAHADRQPPDAAGRAGVFSGDTAAPFFRVREPRIVRQLPATFDRNKPLGLFVVNPAAEDLKPKAKRKQSSHLLSALATGRSTETEINRISKHGSGRRPSQFDRKTETTRRALQPQQGLAASLPTTNVETRKAN
jgi:hypothetical protein